MEQVQGMSLPEGNLKGPNCGITALAVAAEVPFRVALGAIADVRAGLPWGSKKRWNLGTRHSERVKALTALGVPFEETFNILKTVKRPDGVSVTVKSKTVTLESWVCYGRNKDPNKLYMVTTTHHVQTVRGYNVMDQYGPVHIGKYRWKNKRIQSILEIKG